MIDKTFLLIDEIANKLIEKAGFNFKAKFFFKNIENREPHNIEKRFLDVIDVVLQDSIHTNTMEFKNATYDNLYCRLNLSYKSDIVFPFYAKDGKFTEFVMTDLQSTINHLDEGDYLSPYNYTENWHWWTRDNRLDIGAVIVARFKLGDIINLHFKMVKITKVQFKYSTSEFEYSFEEIEVAK